MNAEIITIGDEILIGQIVDTNSAYIAQELNKIGVSVYQITSVQDDKSHILKALNEAEVNADIVIVTGGLGPTKDDITKETLCDYFGDSLVMNQEVLKNIELLFSKLSGAPPLSELNRRQALVPSRCKVLMNVYGNAPGMWIEKNEKTFIGIFVTRLFDFVWKQKGENGSLCYHYGNGGFGRSQGRYAAGSRSEGRTEADGGRRAV